MESKLELQKGISYSFEIEVKEEHSAISMGSGSVPVYATPSLIAHLEKAAMLCVEDHLEESETSVGTYIQINHLKATALGKTVRCFASLIKHKGRIMEFDLKAFEGDDEIGKGTHTRFIIDKEKFMSKLKD